MFSKESFPFEDAPDSKVLSFLPLNHIFEKMVTYIYLYSGISIYYAESLDTIGDNLKEIKPDGFTTVPRLLEKVFEKLQPYTKPKVNYSVLRGGEKFGCPECQSYEIRLRKTYTTPAGTIQHYMSCKSCNKSSYKINNKTFIDYLQWKMKNNL
jgi:hypothetical protein